MFQSFDNPSEKEMGPERLAALRSEMRDQQIDAYLVPHADEHQNEYMPTRAQRLGWLTGFTGSAGFVIVTHDQAVLFVDGRYTLQAAEQVEADHFSIESLIENPPLKWLQNNITTGGAVGYDPFLLTIGQKRKYEKAVKKHGARLIGTPNLIDRIWPDQPPVPLGRVEIHELEYAGKLAREKLDDIRSAIPDTVDAVFLSDPASICWLFNIRGSDVVHTPITLSWCLVGKTGDPILFIDKRKLPTETEAYLTQLSQLVPPNRLDETLKQECAEKSIMVDPDLVPHTVGEWITTSGGKLHEGRDPVILPRAVKNATELEGARKAHIRDGVAVTRFLHWLATTDTAKMDEVFCAEALEEFRHNTAEKTGMPLREISFDTISGFGPNGAIVHYRVSHDSNLPFTENALYLVDSGAQYDDGTTDITRTVAIGTPPDEAVRDFTLVLKGHIAIATARFPKGTRGVDIDVLARNALWREGKDYGHGTGHGIGSFLAVHEGPQSISKRGMAELKPGMIVSNEPGYYKTGEYGIRIENLVIVNDRKSIAGGNVETSDFETITLAPIDRRLVDRTLLDDQERDWLNSYHQKVFETLSPHLNDKVSVWLKEVTAAI